ncbi:MAG: hypothetical protein ACREUG_16295, partial [Steroidobacteraceae bacterium]
CSPWAHGPMIDAATIAFRNSAGLIVVEAGVDPDRSRARVPSRLGRRSDVGRHALPWQTTGAASSNK